MKINASHFLAVIALLGSFYSLPTAKGQNFKSPTSIKDSELQQRDEASRVDLESYTKDPSNEKPVREASIDLLEWVGHVPDVASEETEETQPSPAPLPLHYFDPQDDGSSTINSAILSFISMAVYSQDAQVDDFEDELELLLLPIGAENVEAFVDDQGTEGAVVTLPGATIIAFRGTSGEGTDLPIADQLADINDDPYLVTVGGDEMYVHEGFWYNVDSIYPWIYFRAVDAVQTGRTIWVTGHSLGGALATHTALRLHYDQHISVQGLQTFGSPRVGDLAMFAKFFTKNNNQHDLWSATQRWVVNGDPATTFFTGDYLGLPYVSDYIKYEHVGTTNTIYGHIGEGFKIERNTGEDKDMKWEISGLNQSREHMWYFPALVDEVFLELTDLGEFDVADLLWEALKL